MPFVSAHRRLKGAEPTSIERACLYLLERPGATYASVARELGIAESTVRSHLRSLYAKTGTSTAHQARAVLESRWPAGVHKIA